MPSLAGPKRPQDRITLDKAGDVIGQHLKDFQDERMAKRDKSDEEQARIESEGPTTNPDEPTDEAQFMGAHITSYPIRSVRRKMVELSCLHE